MANACAPALFQRRVRDPSEVTGIASLSHRKQEVTQIDPSTSDDVLIVRAKSGDRHAYGLLVSRYEQFVLRGARALGAGADAEDAAQEAFVSAWIHLDRFEQGRLFKPWVIRILTNEVRTRQRSASRRMKLFRKLDAVEGGSYSDAADVPVVTDEVATTIQRALRRLSEEHRLVVTCRHLLQLTESETVEVLDWPAGTVKSRLSRALARLERDPEVRALLEVSHE